MDLANQVDDVYFVMVLKHVDAWSLAFLLSYVWRQT